MLESNGESGEPCGTPCSLSITTPSGSTTLALSILPISTSSRRSLTPLVAVLQMSPGLGGCRVATSAGSKPVTRGVKRRLPQRFEHLPHGLTDHPIDHVGNPQPALPAS
jgi:hypothetical protein